MPPSSIPPPVQLNVADAGFATGVFDFEEERDVGINSIAVSNDGRHIYLGRGDVGGSPSRNPKRLNLSVVAVDAGGHVTGRRLFMDSALALPAGSVSDVRGIAYDGAHSKLLLAVDQRVPGSDALQGYLTVYDLDAGGMPTGVPTTTKIADDSPFGAVLHPSGKAVLVPLEHKHTLAILLDALGRPGTPVPTGIDGLGAQAIALHPNGSRLYSTSGNGELRIIPLDSQTGLPPANPTFSTLLIPVGASLACGAHALYARVPSSDGVQLGYWPLDANGDVNVPPGVDPRQPPPIATGFKLSGKPEFPVTSLTLDTANARLWCLADTRFTDALHDSVTIVDGCVPVAFDVSQAAPQPLRGSFAAVPDDAGAGMGVSGDGRAVAVIAPINPRPTGNRVAGRALRITLVELQASDGLPNGAARPVWLEQRFPSETLRTIPTGGLTLAIGQTIALPLDDKIDATSFPSGEPGLFAVGVGASGDWPHFAQMQLHVSLLDAGGNALRSFADTVQGNAVAFLMSGYASRDTVLFSLLDQSQRYLDQAHAAAVGAGARPKLLHIGAYGIRAQEASANVLQRHAATLSVLGFNMTGTKDWDPIAASIVNKALDDAGLKDREWSFGPDYFDARLFDLQGGYFSFDAGFLRNIDTIAADSTKNAIQRYMGATPESLVDVKVWDEAHWNLVDLVAQVTSGTHPEWLGSGDPPTPATSFRGWLAGKGLPPSLFGQPSWEGVKPILAPSAIDGPSRRLYYWTLRFFAESATAGTSALASAIRRFAPNAGVEVNTQVPGPAGIWYRGGTGLYDWMDLGRKGDCRLWTEDWFNDFASQDWSYYSDVLRSAAAPRDGQGDGRGFGGYVIGGMIGAHRAGALYKLLSLLGHGARTLDVYTFGPFWPGNSWSTFPALFNQLAQALGLVGNAERLLAGGRRPPTDVAILFPRTSQTWDPGDPVHTAYGQETRFLHYALVHAGYAVDFVDDEDVAAGLLARRGYKVLYVAEPNVQAAAQRQMVDWAQAGGLVVALPGAATLDEYNETSTLLDDLLGVRREPTRAPPELGFPSETRGLTAPATFGGDALLVPPFAPRFELAGADAVALFDADRSRPAIAVRHDAGGRTRAVSYAFYPGLQYWRTPDRGDPHRLPLGWNAGARQLAVAPVGLTGASRLVTLSNPVVEACRLDTTGVGTAVTLLNWRDIPLPALKVTVPIAGVKRVTSARGNAVTVDLSRPGTVDVTLGLDDVDVLLFDL